MTRTACLMVRGAVVATLALVSTRALAAGGYEVVLVGGARVSASSRPVVAMGKVSFLDDDRRPVTLPSSSVDVQATRARLGDSRPSGKVWDAKSLAKLDRGSVQFYGEDVPGPPPESEMSSDTATTTGGAAVSPAEKLREQIDGLGAKIKELPTSDRQRSLMVIRQLELQEELTRVLSPPPARG